MEKERRNRYIPFETLLPGKTQWGVLDRDTNKLVETANEVEAYPITWAIKRADQLNKD